MQRTEVSRPLGSRTEPCGRRGRSQLSPELAAALAPLAKLLAPMLAPMIAPLLRGQVDADPMVPLFGTLPGKSKRAAAALGRSGAIEGARKIGRVWSARRSRIDAYLLEAHRPAEVENAEVEGDDLDRELARAGWR